jgi:hypothetical protein
MLRKRFSELQINRRAFMRAAGMGSLILGGAGQVGLYVKPGQTVRWICTKWGASVTAFHPENDNRELRIPENAQPFDSGLLGDDINTTFEWTFEEEGTYDYFSRNHEVLGTVGRIVVGQPGGPAEKPLGYGGREGRLPIFPRVKEVLDFVSSQEIVNKKLIRYPRQKFERRFPY